ncbi:MAG TPA: GNAT family N-acetyltransferase [Acidothermaceae bacterium]|nr:GNAT family N-acetyltransferase [Acidothermaceae bacterium]
MDVGVIVEDLMAYVRMPPGADRLWLENACLNFQPGSYPYFANVSAVRVGSGSVEELVTTAKSWFSEHGRTDFTWFLGPSSTPHDVVDQLVKLGATVMRHCTAMTMDRAPEPVAGVVVAEVESASEYLQLRRIMFADEETGELTVEQDAELLAANEDAWARVQAMDGSRRNFLAFVDGEPVAGGGLQLDEQGFAVLAGSATLPASRGRGCYRALVHRRWMVAQEAGIGHLAIQASDYSAPILSRIGFVERASLTIMQQSCA